MAENSSFYYAELDREQYRHLAVIEDFWQALATLVLRVQLLSPIQVTRSRVSSRRFRAERFPEHERTSDRLDPALKDRVCGAQEDQGSRIGGCADARHGRWNSGVPRRRADAASRIGSSSHPQTYDDYIDDKTLRRNGVKKWSRRVRKAIKILYSLLHYDVLYLGGMKQHKGR